MKPFKLKLAAVGTVRQRRENDALLVYARALMNRAQATQVLRVAEQDLAEAQAAWQRESGRGCHAADMARHSEHCERLNGVRLERLARLAEAERESDLRMHELLHTRREREAVDKYHTRQRLAHGKAVAREDQKALDELTQAASPFSVSFLAEREGQPDAEDFDLC